MTRLQVYKNYMHDFFDNHVDKEQGETWKDYWGALNDALQEEHAIREIGGELYVLEGYELNDKKFMQELEQKFGIK